MNIRNKSVAIFAMAMISMSAVVSCVDEPDASELYESLELTIEQTLENDEDLSAFNAILKKTIYANTLSTWGNYSCFAPVNEGVSLYLDSLYNDTSCDGVVKPYHNGIPETAGFENLDVMEKVELLPKSLCVDLAKYHLSGSECTISEVTGSTSWNTMLIGRYIHVTVSDGKTWLGPDAYIIDADVSCSNGLIQKLSGMVRREDRLIAEQLSVDENFKIFSEAMKATGLDLELAVEKKDTVYTLADTKPTNRIDEGLQPLYCPTECKVGFTIFAESDEVFKKNGITSLEDLIQKCKEWYGNPIWYDYVKEKGVQISTGDDYTNEWNVLHMFVAYHILRAGMPVDQIVFEKTTHNQSQGWNISFGYEPNEYFETMLPNTLLKVWGTDAKDGKEPKLWINRYLTNNTLTDEYGTFGSDAIHTLVFPGVQIDRTYNKETLNGYIHKIDDILKYDDTTVKSLYERLRFDSSTFLYELINNGIRNATIADISQLNGGGNGARVAFDVNYFDNIVCYNPNTILRFSPLGTMYRAHNGDQFQGWDTFDLAFKLPHVPTGEYELRIIYPPMIRGGMMQYYLGESSNQADMVAQGIPFDAQLNPYENASFGYIDVDPENGEYGIESDQAMHVRGYMRAPASFSRGTYNTITDKLTVTADDPYAACKRMTGGTSCRTESGYGTMMLRRVICTQTFKQGTDYWLRIKNLVTNASILGWSFDFIELVPVGIVNNQTLMEDWY